MRKPRSGCCLSRMRRRIQTSSSRLCPSSLCTHTCEFLICARPLLCRDPETTRLHWIRTLHLAGNCVHPDWFDSRRGTRCREIASRNRTSTRHAESVFENHCECTACTIVHETEIILVLRLNTRTRTIYSKQLWLCYNLNLALAEFVVSYYSPNVLRLGFPHLSLRCMLDIIYSIFSLCTNSTYALRNQILIVRAN